MKSAGSVRKAALVFGLMLLLAPGLSAASNIGFYIGTGVGGAFPNMTGDAIDVIEPESGLCLELIHLGYNFTDNVGVTFQWGAADGPMSDDVYLGGYQAFGDDSLWGQGYMDLGVRLSLPLSDMWVPYFEVGAGNYVFLIMGDEGEFDSDPEIGFRFAIGANYYIGNFYIAPEFAYHAVNYEEGEIDHDVFGTGTMEFDATGNMSVLMIKLGYHFRKS